MYYLQEVLSLQQQFLLERVVVVFQVFCLLLLLCLHRMLEYDVMQLDCSLKKEEVWVEVLKVPWFVLSCSLYCY